MEQKLQIIAVLLFQTACATSFDPEKVDVGMTEAQLIEAVGKPNEVLPMTEGVVFWRYKDDNTVMLSEGEVVNVGVMSDADYDKTMRQFHRASNGLQEM